MIRLGAVGDVVRTLPAVSQLRAAYPGSHIAWLVEPRASGVLAGQPWIDETLVFPRDDLQRGLSSLRPDRAIHAFARFARELRRRRFDLVLDFHSIFRSALLARMARAPMRVAYARPFGREIAYRFATHRVHLAPPRMSRFARNAGMLEYLRVGEKPAPMPLVVDPALRAGLAARLGDAQRPVVLHPGSSDATPYKRYSVAGYASVAKALAGEEGLPVVVTFGPAQDDREIADAVVGASGGAARLAPPTRDFAELAALLSTSRLFIGSDTGPLHVASMVGTPVVQLIGPTDPVVNAPYAATPSRTVRVHVPCSPCRRGCATASCMRLIPPVAILRAARELLADGIVASRSAP